MKVIVINCGSSSIKYQVHDASLDQVLAKGIVARIGEEGSSLRHQAGDTVIEKNVAASSHGEAFEVIRRALLDPKGGVISGVSEISAVGHRVVHGGETFVDSVLITDDVVAKLEKCISLAPLHNRANVTGIREARRALPDIPHVAVFDTAFHQTLPPKAYLYALPYDLYETHKIRRYGFHGTSYRYVSKRAAGLLGKPVNKVKMIICHLGNGVSVAALDGGKSVDTSMGLTPLEGLIMGTRSGDVDPGRYLLPAPRAWPFHRSHRVSPQQGKRTARHFRSQQRHERCHPGGGRRQPAMPVGSRSVYVSGQEICRCLRGSFGRTGCAGIHGGNRREFSAGPTNDLREPGVYGDFAGRDQERRGDRRGEADQYADL